MWEAVIDSWSCRCRSLESVIDCSSALMVYWKDSTWHWCLSEEKRKFVSTQSWLRPQINLSKGSCLLALVSLLVIRATMPIPFAITETSPWILAFDSMKEILDLADVLSISFLHLWGQVEIRHQRWQHLYNVSMISLTRLWKCRYRV